MRPSSEQPFILYRKSQRGPKTLYSAALKTDLSLVKVDCLPGKVQPEAGALFARFRPLEGEKPLENLFPGVFGNPGSFVAAFRRFTYSPTHGFTCVSVLDLTAEA